MNFTSDSLSIFTASRLPRRPLCTDHLADGCWHERQEHAIQRRYLQINPPRTALWMAFDVDRPGGGLAWQDAGLPPPAWSCTTRTNGHGHLVYGLEVPVIGQDFANKSVRYLEAVREGYRSRLGGDPGFAGVLTKNPRHPDWLLERGVQKLWTLGELAEFVELPSVSTKKNQTEGGRGRNVDTFDRLRFWAYRNVSDQRLRGREAWANAVHRQAEKFNSLNAPGLNQREVAHIAKSVSLWVWERYTGASGAFNQLASEAGKQGGRPKTTTADGAPWVAAGVSRATWYRSQKTQQQTSSNCAANETKASESPLL